MAVRNRGQMRATVKRRMGASPQVVDPTDYDDALADIHRQVAAGFQWSMRRREQVLQTVASSSTGTIAVTVGSPTVVGTGTAWTAAMVGRQITIPGESTFFYVQAVADPTHLTLGDADGSAQNWVQASASGLTYTIFQSVFLVPANVSQILSQTRDWPLGEVSSDYIDQVDPRRLSTSSGTPTNWAWVRTGVVSNAVRRYIELWPVPTTPMTIRLPYLIEPQDFTGDASLPQCPSEILEWWAVMDLSYATHAKTGDARWIRQAESARAALNGNPQTGEVGVIQAAIQYDLQQFGLPRRLGEGGFQIGNDVLSSRDWALLTP